MSSLNDFIDPDLTTSDVIHSSGYAQAASGSTMGGGGGGLSMDQRRAQLHNDNRRVRSYRESILGSRFGGGKARAVDQSKNRAYDASSGQFTDDAKYGRNRQGGGIKDRQQIDTASIERRQHFIEPQARTHDPYA